MKQETKEQPHQLSIDVEQWSSDIETFAKTTREALDAIIAELSASCSSQPADMEMPGVVREFPSDWAGDTSRIDSDTPAARQDERLEKLKSQLARRISKSN